jgi:hypothetical protein
VHDRGPELAGQVVADHRQTCSDEAREGSRITSHHVGGRVDEADAGLQRRLRVRAGSAWAPRSAGNTAAPLVPSGAASGPARLLQAALVDPFA